MTKPAPPMKGKIRADGNITAPQPVAKALADIPRRGLRVAGNGQSFREWLDQPPLVGPRPLPEPDDCPFCGNRPRLMYNEFPDTSIWTRAWIECDGCGATQRLQLGYRSRERALERWNDRGTWGD